MPLHHLHEHRWSDGATDIRFDFILVISGQWKDDGRTRISLCALALRLQLDGFPARSRIKPGPLASRA